VISKVLLEVIEEIFNELFLNTNVQKLTKTFKNPYE